MKFINSGFELLHLVELNGKGKGTEPTMREGSNGRNHSGSWRCKVSSMAIVWSNWLKIWAQKWKS